MQRVVGAKLWSYKVNSLGSYRNGDKAMGYKINFLHVLWGKKWTLKKLIDHVAHFRT